MEKERLMITLEEGSKETSYEEMKKLEIENYNISNAGII